MSEKPATPEERAENFEDRLGEYFASYSVYPAKFRPALTAAFRAAVQVETERAAKIGGVIGMSLFREVWTLLEKQTDVRIQLEDMPGWGNRVAAAIRAEPESDGEGGEDAN